MQKLLQNNEEENLKIKLIFTQKTNLEYPIPFTKYIQVVDGVFDPIVSDI